MSDRPPVFVHAADLHLGAPLRALGKGINEERRAQLVKLADQTFDNLIDESIRLNAEFVVLSGDIYDGAEREAHAQIRFSVGLKRLVTAGIPVYIVHGNHDPLLNSVVNVVSLPEGVTVFGSDNVTSFRHTLRDGRTVLIAGVSYADKREERRLASMFNGIKRDGDTAVVGVLHTNLGGVSSHGNYAPSSESELSSAPVDYWALGHVHKRQVKQIGPNRYWAYPGNLQGRDAGETGPKGALVVPILTSGVGEPQFLPLDTFRFANLEIDCKQANDLSGIASQISAMVLDLSDGRPMIVRVNLRGRSAAHSAVSATPNLEQELEMLCGEALNHGYVERVKSFLLPELDLETLKAGDDLLGDLLRAMENLDPSVFDPAAVELNASTVTAELISELRALMTADLLADLYTSGTESA